MAVYIDNFGVPYKSMIMCHMIADTTAELLAMADAIGVHRRWIQKPGTCYEHFDVCLSKRDLATRAGAIQLTSKGIVSRMLAKKETL